MVDRSPGRAGGGGEGEDRYPDLRRLFSRSQDLTPGEAWGLFFGREKKHFFFGSLSSFCEQSTFTNKKSNKDGSLKVSGDFEKKKSLEILKTYN